MGMEKKRGGVGGKDTGETERETENYIAVCKNQFKTCEAERNGRVS